MVKDPPSPPVFSGCCTYVDEDECHQLLKIATTLALLIIYGGYGKDMFARQGDTFESSSGVTVQLV